MGKTASSNKLVLYNTLSTVILYAITFFSAPLFSRLLGTENYGVVQVYNTWTQFFVVLSGLYTRGTLSIAKANMDEGEFIRYQSSILFLSLCAFISIFAGMMIFHEPVVAFFGLDLGYLMMMMFQSFGTYCVYFLNTKFTYEMKAKYNLVVSVTLALANFGLSYLLIKCFRGECLYTGRILGMAFPHIVAGAIILIYVFRQGKVFFDKKYWKFCLPLCLPLIFHGISGIICSSSDRVMIQKMIGLTAVGIYTLAHNFANIMDSIWGALHNSWDPFFFEYVKRGQFSLLKIRSKRYLRLYTCLAIGFVLLTPEVYHIFAAQEYWEGIIVIPIIVMSTYAIFIYAFAANYEFCFKRTDMVAIGSVIAGCSNVVLNMLFINLLGYFGAAVATVLSNIILVAVHVIFARHLAGNQWVYDLRMFAWPVAALSATVVLFFVCIDHWIVRWGAAAVVGFYMLVNIWKEKTIF